MHAPAATRPGRRSWIGWCPPVALTCSIETWEAWETWFRSMGEAQALSPLIAFDRSVRRRGIMGRGDRCDARRRHVRIDQPRVPGRAAADVCISTGEQALAMVERALAPAMRRVPTEVAIPDFDHAGYDALRARLEAEGVPLHGDGTPTSKRSLRVGNGMCAW